MSEGKSGARRHNHPKGIMVDFGRSAHEVGGLVGLGKLQRLLTFNWILFQNASSARVLQSKLLHCFAIHCEPKTFRGTLVALGSRRWTLLHRSPSPISSIISLLSLSNKGINCLKTINWKNKERTNPFLTNVSELKKPFQAKHLPSKLQSRDMDSTFSRQHQTM